MPNAAGNLDHFIAGVRATFAGFASSNAELDDFLQSARDFYIDFTSAASAEPPHQTSRLPFWRYLIAYSTAGLDAAASSSGPPDAAVQDLMQEIGNFWPFLPAVVGRAYKPGIPAQPDTAITPTSVAMARPRSRSLSNTLSQLSGIAIEHSSDQGTQTDFDAPPFIPVHPQVPPVRHAWSSQPGTPLAAPARPIFSRTFSRNIDRSRSHSMETASDHTDARSPPPLVFSESQASSSTIESNGVPLLERKPSEPIPQTCAEPALLLADRGDNTAKLLPTNDGTYVLQVSIGGRKLVVNPDKPAEISYHNATGQVVTRSLLYPLAEPLIVS